MKKLLIKYTVAFLVITIGTRLLSAVTLEIFPDLLRTDFEGGYTEFGIEYLHFYLTTLFNIPLAIILGFDLNKMNLKSIPLQILVVLSNVWGIAIFLLVSLYQNTRNEQPA